jgi:alpha-beta hydrolase superfamily lysophospholipase
MTLNAEAARMLQQDPLWRRSQTSAFLVQILLMRLGMLKAARRITLPALVLQAEADKVVIAAATRKFYDALASSDKTWTTYPGYSHDTEFEDDHSLLDNDIADWIHKHSTGEK